MLAALATITIVVGNVGALGQTSLKRMMGYSGVAQAGYMLGGVVVGSHLGVQATILYLFAYLGMNMAVFPAIVASELERPDGDDVAALAGLGARNPWLAWPLTIGMLALAGIPGTVGFIGKFQLIHALVAGNYTWLGIVLVIGSMISLGYYLRVVAAIWMRGGVTLTAGQPAAAGAYAPIAGGSQEADEPGGSGGDGESGEPAGKSPERPGASEEAGGLPGHAGGEHAEGLEPGELPGALSEQGVGAARARGDDSGAASGEDQGETGAPGSPETPAAPPEPGPGGSVPGEDSDAYTSGGGVGRPIETGLVGVAFAAATVFFGIVPGPLFTFAAHAGRAIAGLF
jgi:hypothetical protein